MNDDLLRLLSFLLSIDVHPIVFHLVLLDNPVYINLEVGNSKMLLERLLVVDKKILVQKHKLPWVEISSLKIIEHAFEVKHLRQSDPAHLEVELVGLGCEVSVTFVLLQVEDVSCLFDPAAVEQVIDLVLGWNLLELADLGLGDVACFRVVRGDKHDISCLVVETS